MPQNFEHFKMRVASFKDGDLYLHTSGYALFIHWPSGKTKVLLPDERGRIFLKCKQINFHRLLYKLVHPKEPIKNKLIIRVGRTSNILNLVSIPKAQIRNARQLKLWQNECQKK